MSTTTARLASGSPTLGSIIWFTIGGTSASDGATKVNRNQLGAWFDELSLPADRLPPAARRVDAFRAASSATTRTFHAGLNDERVLTYAVREVTFNDHVIIRLLTRTETDQRGRAVSMDTVAELKFYRAARTGAGRRAGTEEIIKTIAPRIQGEDRAHVEEWMAAFEASYNTLGEWLSASALRKVVRDTVTDLNAIPVKPSGGVYFVHHDRQKYVDALEDLITKFGPGSSFHQLPLVDEQRQRAMLAESFAEDVGRSADKQIAAIVDAAARTGRVSAAKYREFYEDYQALVQRCGEHADKLELTGRPARAPLAKLATALTEVAEPRPTASA